MFRSGVVLLAAVLPLSIAICVPFSGIAEASKLQAAFIDWSVDCTVQCKLLPNAATSSIDPEQFRITIAQREADRSGFAIMSVPTGVYLSPGVLISVDRKRPFKVLYELCDPAKCHASFKLNGPVLKAFKQGRTATIRVWLKKDHVVDFPVSLAGFTQAYAQFQTRSAR